MTKFNKKYLVLFIGLICIILTLSSVNAENITSDSIDSDTNNQVITNNEKNNLNTLGLQDSDVNQVSNDLKDNGDVVEIVNDDDIIADNKTDSKKQYINHYVNDDIDLSYTLSNLNSITTTEYHNIYLKRGNYSNNRFEINNNFLKLTIRGNGSIFNKLAFTIGENTNVLIENVTFDNCIHDYDSVIINEGNIIINNCTFKNNNFDGFGSCINNNYGLFYVNNSIFINNNGSYGGVFYNINQNTTINISNCIFDNNSANKGAVIYSIGSVSIYNNTFINNVAEDCCIAYSVFGITNITNNTITNNYAHFACICGSYNEKNTKIIVKDNIVLSNYANISFICAGYNTEVINNTIIDCYSGYAFAYFPRVYEETNEIGLIQNNTIFNSSFDDAFIIISCGKFNIINNIFSQNNATFIRNNDRAILESNIISNNTEKFCIILNDIMIQHNVEKDTYKECIGVITLKNNEIYGNNVSVYGTIMNSANMTLINNNIYNNYAQNNGGAINNMGNITIENNTFENNTSEFGGVLYNLDNCTVINNTFIDNNATIGGCTYNIGNISFTNNTFENNNASSGKVIENMVGANAEFENNTILDDNIIVNENTSNYADNFELNDKSLKTSGKTIKKSEIISNKLDNVDFNEITSDSRKNFLVVNDPNSGITFILKNYGNITLKNSKFNNIQNNPNNNLFNSLGNITFINNSFMDNKLKTRIIVEDVNTTWGDTFTLRASIIDEHNNNVQSGNVIFKINGLTLKNDMKFGSKSETLQIKVVNGIAEVNITSYLLLRNTGNITAKYIGDNIYNSSSTNTNSKIKIQLRTAYITGTTSKIANQDSNLLLTANIYDSNKNKYYKLFDDDYVIFKVNGITIKDNKNNPIKVYLNESGLAQINYKVPVGLAGIYTNLENRYYTVTAIFVSKGYNFCIENITQFTVNRSTVSFNDMNITYNNKTRKITIKAKLQDYHKNMLKGKSNLIIKFNGITYKINNKTQAFTVENGVVDLSFTILSNFKVLKQVELVTGQRVGYLGGRKTTTKITMI